LPPTGEERASGSRLRAAGAQRSPGVPAPVLAHAWRGGKRQAVIARLLTDASMTTKGP
jgi:hypothetical protein